MGVPHTTRNKYLAGGGGRCEEQLIRAELVEARGKRRQAHGVVLRKEWLARVKVSTTL